MAKKTVLATAPPPLPLVALLVAVVAVCLNMLPSMEAIDNVATLEGLTTSPYMDSKTLAYARGACAAVIFGVQLFIISSPGWDEDITYLPGSKLKECKVHFKGCISLMWFTAQSWVLLGVYFASASLLALSASSTGSEPPVWLLRTVLVLWEIAAPNALLVSTVVTYVIWPEVFAKGGSALTANLKMPHVLMQHNLNAALVFANLSMTSSPLAAGHAAIAPLFGCAYVIFFAWIPASHIAPQHGAVYLYFFFDTTRGAAFSCTALIALLSCLLLFYAIAVGLVGALAYLAAIGVPGAVRGFAVAALCLSICKVRD